MDAERQSLLWVAYFGSLSTLTPRSGQCDCSSGAPTVAKHLLLTADRCFADHERLRHPSGCAIGPMAVS